MDRRFTLFFFCNHYVSIGANDERYGPGENEDGDTSHGVTTVTSPDISQSVETVVDDSNQGLCARESSIGNSAFVENVAVEYDIGDCLNRSVDDFTRCQILQKHWKPAVGFEFPFSVHRKKGREEKRYLKQSHLDLYPWLVFSRSKQGLLCKYCPLFVTGAVGGMQKTVPLQQLVTKPLCSYAKLLGKDGDLESHSKNHYHIAAVQAAFDFLRTYHNPAKEVVNQLSSNRSQQIHENRQRLIPIVETIVFLGRQNIAFRGHRDDGALLTERDKNTNDGNFRQLLKFRVNSGDKVLETHLKTVSARATYISKTVQNELIDCCGQEIVLGVLRRVHDSRFYSIMFDETTDVSHTSQMSLSLRYVHDGTVREDFVQFIDAYGEAYSDWDSAEKSEPVSSGTVLGGLVVKTVKSLSLNPAYCVGIGTDGCSVMTSAVCGAVSAIQRAMPRAVRCPCFSHALNLSISKSSSVQCACAKCHRHCERGCVFF